MKRLIIAQIKIELDSERSDYENANIGERWQTIISDYLVCSERKVRDYLSIQIDETKDLTNNKQS